MVTTYNGTVYLSGPIAGLTYEEARHGWRQDFAVGMRFGIKVLSPMRHEGHLAEVRGPLEAAEQAGHFFSGSKVIVEKDRLDIERSDIILVNLLGASRVSIGTVAEIGMAFMLGKKIVLVIEDAGTVVIGRQYVDDDPKMGPDYAGHWEPVYGSNIHDHPFVTIPASLRLNNLQDAIDAVNSLLSEGI